MQRINCSKSDRSKSLLLYLMAVLSIVFVAGCSRAGRPHDIKSVEINGHTWTVEVAASPAAQALGLSGRPALASSTGMLFIFGDLRPHNFWMREMSFPLDIVWIKDYKIVKIDEHLPPAGSQPSVTYPSGGPIDSVLEINAGEAARFGLKAGDKIYLND